MVKRRLTHLQKPSGHLQETDLLEEINKAGRSSIAGDDRVRKMGLFSMSH